MQQMKDDITSLTRGKKTVFIYVSKADEPDTREIIRQLLLDKTVVVPVCSGKSLIPSVIHSMDELQAGSYGVLEPAEIRPVAKKEIDIFFVPGTAFDRNGNRKGRGMGYFDRFLEDVDREKIIGVCFPGQVCEELQPNPWDVPVAKLIKAKR